MFPTTEATCRVCTRLGSKRSQGIFKRGKDAEDTILGRILGFIFMGKVPAGGTLTYHAVMQHYTDTKYLSAAILLQSRGYGQGSIYGTLVEDGKVRDRLDNLVNIVLKRWKEIKQQSKTDTLG